MRIGCKILYLTNNKTIEDSIKFNVDPKRISKGYKQLLINPYCFMVNHKNECNK